MAVKGLSVHVCLGLEAQLLGNVVRKERPELEEQKDLLVRNIADGKKKLQQLEDEILRYTVSILIIKAELVFTGSKDLC